MGFDCFGGRVGDGRRSWTTAPLTAQRVSKASGLKAFRPLPFTLDIQRTPPGRQSALAPPHVGCTFYGPGSSCRASAGIVCPSLPSRPGAGRDGGSTVNSGGQSRCPRRWSDPSPTIREPLHALDCSQAVGSLGSPLVPREQRSCPRPLIGGGVFRPGPTLARGGSALDRASRGGGVFGTPLIPREERSRPRPHPHGVVGTC